MEVMNNSLKWWLLGGSTLPYGGGCPLRCGTLALGRIYATTIALTVGSHRLLSGTKQV
jgi:hypothetical protein